MPKDDHHLLELKEAGRAIAALAEDERRFAQPSRRSRQAIGTHSGRHWTSGRLLPHCHRICFWLCIWRCVRVCRLICADLPTAAPTPGEIVELSKLLQPLRDNADLLKRLLDAMDRGDTQTLATIVKELKIQRFCFFVFSGSARFAAAGSASPSARARAAERRSARRDSRLAGGLARWQRTKRRSPRPSTPFASRT